jgi:hypothetical protein
MALAQSGTNFLYFSANADTTGNKRLMVSGILITKTGAAVAGKYQVRNAASALNYIPLTAFPAAAPPTLLSMVFPGDGIEFPSGLKSTFMSGCTMMVFLKS